MARPRLQFEDTGLPDHLTELFREVGRLIGDGPTQYELHAPVEQQRALYEFVEAVVADLRTTTEWLSSPEREQDDLEVTVEEAAKRDCLHVWMWAPGLPEGWQRPVHRDLPKPGTMVQLLCEIEARNEEHAAERSEVRPAPVLQLSAVLHRPVPSVPRQPAATPLPGLDDLERWLSS